MNREELFNRYLKKELNQVSQKELKMLLSTAEGRQEFYEFMSETSQINQHLKFDDKLIDEDLVFSNLVKQSEENLIKGLAPETATVDELIRRRRLIKPQHLLYMSVLSIAAMLVFVLVFHKESSLSRNEAALINSVARVINLDGQANVALGEWLRPGDILLTSGEMELAFDSGARVLLQERAEFRLETASRAFLKEGKLTAYVPAEAKGFIINTQEGTIVDLGTEFAVNVDRYQKTEIHVLSGEVEASLAAGNETKLLKKDESLRISDGEFGESLLSVNSFKRLDMQGPSLKTSYIYWPFDSVESGRVKDLGNGGFGDFYDLSFASEDMYLQPGKFGNSLNLNGKGQFLTSKFKGVGGPNPRTISFWLKIPPSLKDGEHYAIIAWGRVAPTEKWQLGINFQRANGVKGAIRTEFSKGYVVGTTDLRDGRWHHITSLFIGGDNADVATHVRHYVDGRLEGVSGYQSVKINTAITAPDSQPAYIGKYINRDTWFLRGAIDEMYIFESALTPAQIVMLRDRELEAE